MNTIEAVVYAADKQIVGKIRAQKIFYLLEKLGMNAGYSFSYHHYGPYSRDLANSIDATCMFGGRLKEDEQTGQYGNSYSVFSLAEECGLEETNVGALDFKIAKEYITKMKDVSSVVIELAATIYWLQKEENVSDWQTELRARKTHKATNERIEKAVQLLKDITLI